ncbi:MAG: hypothetical protein AAGA48_21340 [Myxococcota bacterium]
MDKLAAFFVGQLLDAPWIVAASLFFGFSFHVALLSMAPALEVHLGMAGSLLYAFFLVQMACLSAFPRGTSAYLTRRNTILWLSSRSICSVEQGIRLLMWLERIYLAQLHPVLARQRFAHWDFILTRGLGPWFSNRPVRTDDPAATLQCAWHLVQTIEVSLPDAWFAAPPFLRKRKVHAAIVSAEPSLPPAFRAWLATPRNRVRTSESSEANSLYDPYEELTPIRQSRPSP